jgi:hypothetical protein
MLCSFFRGLVLLAVISLATVFLATGNAFAQRPPEPSLAGVTYRELAEWEMMYGRGRFYGGYGQEFYGEPNMGYFCPPEQPPVCDNPKIKSRNGRK